MYEVIGWFDTASKITIVKRINELIVSGTQLACVLHENKGKKNIRLFSKRDIEIKRQKRKQKLTAFIDSIVLFHWGHLYRTYVATLPGEWTVQ